MMQRFYSNCRNSCWSWHWTLWMLVASAAGVSRADTLSIVRVEEDWELLIGTPDDAGDSPQITTAMSPAGDDEGDYCSFEMNHQSQPTYFPGGLHLHAWDGEYLLGSAHAQAGYTLCRVHESIAWTQVMSLSDGHLHYEVQRGSSETWGEFGGENLRVSIASTLPNLNGYDPSASLQDSGVGYGANRVLSLTLRRVRLISSVGETFEININQDVLQYGE